MPAWRGRHPADCLGVTQHVPEPVTCHQDPLSPSGWGSLTSPGTAPARDGSSCSLPALFSGLTCPLPNKGPALSPAWPPTVNH